MINLKYLYEVNNEECGRSLANCGKYALSAILCFASGISAKIGCDYRQDNFFSSNNIVIREVDVGNEISGSKKTRWTEIKGVPYLFWPDKNGELEGLKIDKIETDVKTGKIFLKGKEQKVVDTGLEVLVNVKD